MCSIKIYYNLREKNPTVARVPSQLLFTGKSVYGVFGAPINIVSDFLLVRKKKKPRIGKRGSVGRYKNLSFLHACQAFTFLCSSHFMAFFSFLPWRWTIDNYLLFTQTYPLDHAIVPVQAELRHVVDWLFFRSKMHGLLDAKTCGLCLKN